MLTELASLLGKDNFDALSLKKLKKLNIINRLEINPCDYEEYGLKDSFYINNELLGVSLLFVEESIFNKLYDEEILGRKYFLDTVFFYNEGVEGFSKYKGGLPYGINYNMNRVDVNKFLNGGVSRLVDCRLVSEKWDNKDDKYNVFISYNKSLGIRYISISYRNY